MRIRGFEIADGFDKNINIPKRSTAHSAGYDIECCEDIAIPPHTKDTPYPTLVKTGLKAYMPEDEALFIYNRSGNPIKRGLVLANSVGVIDCDYYGNANNDGHIMMPFYNFTPNEVIIKAGERIGQGIFQKFLKCDGDMAEGERIGGFGSTKM